MAAHRGTRPSVAVLLLLLGAAVGVASVLLHARWWGMAAGLGATAAWLVALPGGWWLRPPFALGWVGAVLVLAPERPEGDYLVAGDAAGWVLLGAGVVVLMAGVLGVRRRPDPSSERVAITGGGGPAS